MIEIIENKTCESTVTISNRRFEELIRESEKLTAIMALASTNGYICKNDLFALLGIKEGGEDSCQQ